MNTYLCRSEAATEAAGREIACALPRDAVVHLVGDLGSGKTFLARAIATELGADPREVSSPSFVAIAVLDDGAREITVDMWSAAAMPPL